MTPPRLAAASLVCGLVPFAMLVLDHRDFGSAPVAFAIALAAVLAGVAARRANSVRSSTRWMAGGGIALGLVFLVFVGMTWVDFMQRHSRGPDEAAVLRNIRLLISAEHEYRDGLGKGNFCSLACLVTPALCMPGYTGAPLLREPFVYLPDQPHYGYRGTFHAGALVPEPAMLSPAGRLRTFAYTAVPVKVGTTGTRGFCGDSTGRLCFTVDGSAPPVKDGLCDTGCAALR